MLSDRMLSMLNIRLQRVGRKNDPSFRVIVVDSKLKPKAGNFLEILGSYDARKGKPVVQADRVKHWLSVGARASGTVHNILLDLGIVKGKKVNVLGKKTPIMKDVPVAPAEAPASASAPEAIPQAEPAATEVTTA